MSRHGTAHWDVAAYALGVLDPADVLRCEAHLAECESCAAELESLLPATKLLADVDLEGLRQAEESQLAERLVDTVRLERRRSHRRQRLVAATGTVVAAGVAGLALLAGATWLSTEPAGQLAGDPPVTVSPSPPEPSADSGPDQVGGERFAADDPVTGVHAEVTLAVTDWGTQVSFAISAVSGPLECQLQLVRLDGSTETIGSWQVPEAGYGTPAQPDPLLVQAPTAADRADIGWFQVQATAPDGAVSTVVTVPV